MLGVVVDVWVVIVVVRIGLIMYTRHGELAMIALWRWDSDRSTMVLAMSMVAHGS